MNKEQLENVIASIKNIQFEYVKRFTTPDGFPGYFEGTNKFEQCIEDINSLEDWELEDDRNVGDVIMKNLYTETIDPTCQFAEEEVFMNFRIRKFMVSNKLYRYIDTRRWNLNKEGK